METGRAFYCKLEKITMLRRILALACLALLWCGAAQAQQAQIVSSCGMQSMNPSVISTSGLYIDSTGNLCASSSGGGGGSSTPFTPNGNYNTLTATASTSASTAMPAGATVAFQNTSSVDVSCVLSAGAATATTNKIIVRAGATVFVAVGSNTNAACINQTGSASNVVVMAGGTGLGTNFGGATAGGGGGGAVTLASGAVASGAYSSGSIASGAFASGSIGSGAMVDLGAIADAAATAGGTGSLSAKLRLMTTQLDTLNTNVTSSIPTGTNVIGDVNLRQGGTVLSATNGIYSNLLQGNAVISATNGLYNNLLQGNAVISATNGLFANVLQGNAVLSITNPSFARAVAGATGGASTTGNIAANNTTAVVVKASAGTLYGAQLSGIGSAPAYLKIYNATSATCGSGTPVKRLMIPAASTAANGAGSNINFGAAGVDFSTGIAYCITTGFGDSDTTAPAASTFLVNLDWK